MSGHLQAYVYQDQGTCADSAPTLTLTRSAPAHTSGSDASAEAASRRIARGNSCRPGKLESRSPQGEQTQPSIAHRRLRGSKEHVSKEKMKTLQVVTIMLVMILLLMLFLLMMMATNATTKLDM